MSRRDLTAEILREKLNYDPETGVFTRRKHISSRYYAGSTVGTVNFWGYVILDIGGYKYMAHRVAWLYVHGEWPKHNIDHINGVRTDNRICNLRDVPQSVNLQNRHVPAQNAPYLGVNFHKASGKWRATIGIDGTQKHLGCFATPEQARDVYLEAKRVVHTGVK